jgi:P450-derived glycosyltransferase activator
MTVDCGHMVTSTDSELGRTLLAKRSMQWLYAHSGDLYARLLRDEEDDRGALVEQLSQQGPIFPSRTGAWVVGSYHLGTEILADARFATWSWEDFPDGHTLRHGDFAGILPADGIGAPSREELGRDELDRSAEAAERLGLEVAGRLGGEFDLVSGFVRPVLVALVAESFGIAPTKRESLQRLCAEVAIALDATMCPPRLAAARAMFAAAPELRSMLSTCGSPDSPRTAAGMAACVFGVEVAASLVVNAALPLLDDPSHWCQLNADPERAEDAIAEALVEDPPVRLHGLVAREDLDLAGARVVAGSQVVVSVEAAQRDARTAGLPETSRTQPLCLAGPHLLPVRSFILTSAAGALRALAAAHPDLHRAGPLVRRLRAPVTHAVVRLPVAARRSRV